MGYQTRQGERIAALLAASAGNPLTAAEIAGYLHQAGTPVGLATVYRHLDKLTAQGQIKKIVPADATGVRYEHNRDHPVAGDCFYLKCEDCGRLIPLHCELLRDVRTHIMAEHHFTCNPKKSILYGTCRGCRSEGEPAR